MLLSTMLLSTFLFHKRRMKSGVSCTTLFDGPFYKITTVQCARRLIPLKLQLIGPKNYVAKPLPINQNGATQDFVFVDLLFAGVLVFRRFGVELLTSSNYPEY